MRRNTFQFFTMVFVVMLMLTLGACSSGGGGGSSSSSSGTSSSSSGGGASAATALTVASKVSVVDPQLTGSVAAAASAMPLSVKWFDVRAWLRSAVTVTSDYEMDKTEVYVDEVSTNSLDTINNILCMVGQTKYDAMLNKGSYIALVDNNQCNSNNSDVSSAGQQAQNQSSGANMPDYMSFTVVSSRASNTSNEIVQAWVHQPASDHDQEALIYANIVISEGTSTQNPYGIFTMNFAGFPITNGTVGTTAMFEGTLKAVRSVPTDLTSKVLLQFVSNNVSSDGNGGIQTSTQKVSLDRQPDGSGGAGRVFQNYVSSSGSGTTDFDIAFNTTDFFRKDVDTGDTVCLSRTLFEESAWSYGLYDTTGARVTRNSGFSITFTQNGTQHQGYVGYWGLWTDGTSTLGNGDQVNETTYNNGNTTLTPYTVFMVGGRLHKHVKQLLTLGNITNVPIQYNEWSGSTGTNYEVVWDGTTLNKIAFMPQNCSGNCTWANLPSPVAIDVTHLTNGGGSINFWSDSLGGQGQIVLSNCTYTSTPVPMGQPPQPGYTSCDSPTGGSQVIFYTDVIVYPGDAVPAALRCYDNCPNATALGVDLNTNNGFMTNMMAGPSMTPTATDYSFSASAGAGGMTLMLGSYPAILTSISATQQYGIQSGPLFDPSSANVALLACPAGMGWGPGQICSWQAWSVLPEFYTWETGPNTWIQCSGVKDSNGTFVKFDSPLMVKYVGLGDPYGTLGTTFMLQYGGFGQLNGIPGKCVDMNTGLDADCSTGNNGNNTIRWVPQFTIPTTFGGNPTTLTDGADSTIQYFVKPLEVEQRMKADPGACTALQGTDFSSYTLPDMTLWSDPVAANGAEPTVTGAPAVIGGVVQ